MHFSALLFLYVSSISSCAIFYVLCWSYSLYFLEIKTFLWSFEPGITNLDSFFFLWVILTFNFWELILPFNFIWLWFLVVSWRVSHELFLHIILFLPLENLLEFHTFFKISFSILFLNLFIWIPRGLLNGLINLDSYIFHLEICLNFMVPVLFAVKIFSVEPFYWYIFFSNTCFFLQFVSLVDPAISVDIEILRDCYESFAMYCFGRYLVACLGIVITIHF